MNFKLSRFDKLAFTYFVGLSPVIIIFMIWAVVTDFMNQTTSGLGWDIFGWVFIAWVIDLIYIVTKMLVSQTVRNVVMARLAGIKERDERESEVAGNAAKFSFLATLALLIFMLVFSVSTFTITKHSKNADGKNGKAIIGFSLNAVDEHAWTHEKKEDVESFNYKGFPLTKPMMILIMIFWQIGSYHLVARRELRE